MVQLPKIKISALQEKLAPFIDKFKDRLSKEKISAGLDIGTSCVKLVRLKFLKESVELVDFAIEPSQIDLVPVLKKLTEGKKISKANISVSGMPAIIRYVPFLKMKPEELKQALKFEAQKHIPFSVSDVNLDAHTLKDGLPDNKMLVLVAAVKKEFVNQRLKIMESAGLRARLIDVDSLALINCFNFNYGDEIKANKKTVGLLNIGTVLSNLNIMDAEAPLLSRDIHFAGNHFSQKIQDAMGIDFKAAEQFKNAAPSDQLDKLERAVEPVVANLAREIRLSFDYYESQNASSVSKIFLSGGASRMVGLKDSLASLLGIEVDYWDPLQKIIIPETIDAQQMRPVLSQLAVAVGLALRQ